VRADACRLPHVHFVIDREVVHILEGTRPAPRAAERDAAAGARRGAARAAAFSRHGAADRARW
jgi:hypothetical protein